MSPRLTFPYRQRSPSSRDDGHDDGHDAQQHDDSLGQRRNSASEILHFHGDALAVGDAALDPLPHHLHGLHDALPSNSYPLAVMQPTQPAAWYPASSAATRQPAYLPAMGPPQMGYAPADSIQPFPDNINLSLATYQATSAPHSSIPHPTIMSDCMEPYRESLHYELCRDVQHKDPSFQGNVYQVDQPGVMLAQQNYFQMLPPFHIDLTAANPGVDPAWGQLVEGDAYYPQYPDPPTSIETSIPRDPGMQWLFQNDLSALPPENLTPAASTHVSTIGEIDSSVIEVPAKSNARSAVGNPAQVPAKRARLQDKPSFEACLVNFEVGSGETKRRRRRVKLEDDKRKEYALQRSVGACHQCRFRKRACTLQTPCEYCIKLAGQVTLAKHICYRDSPFTYHVATDYFIYTSQRRIINFLYEVPKRAPKQLRNIAVRPNDRGFYSAPLHLQVYDCAMHSLSETNRNILLSKAGPEPDDSGKVTIINESDESLGSRLNQWALDYALAFAKAQNNRAGRLLLIGSMYVEKNLPESKIMSIMVLVLSLNYILRTGVTYCLGKCTNTNRAVEARVDTVVYQNLRKAEKQLRQGLENLIWKTYGRLTRQQLFPVAYVLWQWIRLNCLRVSHIANLVMVYKNKGMEYASITETANEIAHMYNLLLSVHTALFRSSTPLLLDFSSPFQQDLLGGDAELIAEVPELQTINDRIRFASYRKPFRSSRAFEEKTTHKLRKLFDGEGLK